MRPVVPTALRAEITEYASLLRALQATDSLDVAARLTQQPTQIDTNSTLWPLFPDELPSPKWTLQDELRVLATRILRSDPDNDGDNETDIDAILPALTHACTAHLTHILATLSAHVPPSEDSMKSRMAPIGWESVLDMVSVTGACDIQSIENVQRRLEMIYGPAENRVVSNIDFRAILDDHFESVCDPQLLDFLTFPPEPEGTLSGALSSITRTAGSLDHLSTQTTMTTTTTTSILPLTQPPQTPLALAAPAPVDQPKTP